MFFAEEKVYNDRISICSDCPQFDSVLTRCKDCGCFLYIKARLNSAKCPQNKWIKHEPPKQDKD